MFTVCEGNTSSSDVHKFYIVIQYCATKREVKQMSVYIAIKCKHCGGEARIAAHKRMVFGQELQGYWCPKCGWTFAKKVVR